MHRLRKILLVISSFFLIFSSNIFAQNFNYNDYTYAGVTHLSSSCSISSSSLTNVTQTLCYNTQISSSNYMYVNLVGESFVLVNDNIQPGDKVLYYVAIAIDKQASYTLNKIQNPNYPTDYVSWYNQTGNLAKYSTTQIGSNFTVLGPDAEKSIILYYSLFNIDSCSDQYCNTSSGTHLYLGSYDTASGYLLSIGNNGSPGFVFNARSRGLMLLKQQTNSGSLIDYTQLLNTISSQLNTIAGNQVTMNDNMVDYIENARDVISSAISSQTSNINAQSVANTNVLNQQIANSAGAVNQQIANSASSINSQISTTGQAISSGISTTNSNLSGISSQLNTIASNQVTANDNLIDYLDLIIANQQQSSGTIDYQYQQQTAQNTSSINQILSTDDMTTTEQTELETVYSDLFDNLSFDSVMEMDGYMDNPSQQKITDLAKNLYQNAIGIFGVNLNSEALDFNSQTNLLSFIANSYNGPTWAKYFDFFNLSAYRIDGSRVNNSFSVKDTSSLVCKPLFVPLPRFALKWLDYSSIPQTRPSVSTTNLALYSNVSAYSVAPFGCSYDVEYKCYGFLIPCLYDIFPDFFFDGWGRAWMWVNAMSIILWLVYDLIHFVLDSLSLTIKPANDTVQFLNKGNK